MEKVRCEFISRLNDMPKEYAEIAIKSFDLVLRDYELQVKEKALSTVVLDLIPKEVNLYLNCKLVEGQSKNGTKNRGIFLSTFFRDIVKPINEVTANDVRAFLVAYQNQRGISDATLNRYRSYLCTFFSWCESEELIDKNPMKNIKPIKYEQQRRVSLTQLELEYIRNACETSREKCIIEMLYSTGCRVSELTNMKKSDIDLNNNIAIVHGKGKKMREVFINAKAKFALNVYWNTRNDDCEYAIVSIRKKSDGKYSKASSKSIENAVESIQQRANIGKHVTPHILRHTTATISLSNGMPVSLIQKMLGHSSCSTTMIYADVSTEMVHQEHLKCVI